MKTKIFTLSFAAAAALQACNPCPDEELRMSTLFVYPGYTDVTFEITLDHAPKASDGAEFILSVDGDERSVQVEGITTLITLTKLESGKDFDYNVTLRHTTKDEKHTKAGGMFYTLPEGPVNLDLPSGLKWTSANLGASRPDENGNYYAWGETEPKTDYSWSTYKWCHEGSSTELTKYVSDDYAGAAELAYKGLMDMKRSLDSADDPATAALGASYRTPSADDWQELLSYCKWESVNFGHAGGYLVKSKSEPNNAKKRIFIPFAGWMSGPQRITGKNDYWACDRALGTSPKFASSFEALSKKLYTEGSKVERCEGHTVRAVCQSN